MPVGPFAVLRFDLAFSLVRDHQIGRFIEIGPGNGDFLFALAGKGLCGVAVDTSDESIATIRERIRSAGVGGIDLHCADITTLQGPFDTAFMFEVLEHIENPVAFLRHVRALLAPEGRIVLSVPAHARLWDATDDISGHVQRFERARLAETLESAGFDDVRVASLGVPFANAAKPLLAAANARRLRRDDSIAESDRDARTASSGLRRILPLSDVGYKLAFNRLTMAPAIALQRLLASTDLGVNYVAVAVAR